MRHPALTRIFSASLALLCLLMLAAGAVGIKKTAAAYSDDRDEAARLDGWAESYSAVTQALVGTVSYADAKARLDARQDAHDEEASQHRTELAGYTATKGGVSSGTEAIYQAQAALDAGWAQYNAGAEEFEQRSAAFEEGYQKFLAGKRQLEAGWAQYNTYSALLSAAQSQLANLKNMGDIIDSGDENARMELTLAAYDGALSAFDQTMGLLEALKAQGAVTDEQLRQLLAAVTEAAGMSPEELRRSVQAARDEVAGTGEGQVIGDAEFELVKTAYDANRALITRVISASESKLGELAAAMQETYDKLKAAQDELDRAEPLMEQGRLAIEQGRAAMEQIKAQLEQGAEALYQGRAELWYQLGKLRQQAEKLRLEKAELETDDGALETLKLSVAEQKELEQRETTLRLDLMSYDGIADRVYGGAALTDAADEYAALLHSEIKETFALRLSACILMVVSAIAGFFTIAPSFELRRCRLPLLPAALCLAFAAAAEIIFVAMGRGSSYTALAASFFAALLTAASLPAKKAKSE